MPGLVWLPGQWTPVHDHGSWGVVGLVRGVLENYYLPGDLETQIAAFVAHYNHLRYHEVSSLVASG